MQEIVASVKRVTDIMGEISAASEEQSSGIDQVNRAVSQMDEVTQQNAALVEERRRGLAGGTGAAPGRGGGGVQDQRRRSHRGTGAPVGATAQRARVAARPAAAPAQPKEESAIAPPVQETAAEQAPVRAPARPAARLAHAAPRAAGGRGRHGGASRAARRRRPHPRTRNCARRLHRRLVDRRSRTTIGNLSDAGRSGKWVGMRGYIHLLASARWRLLAGCSATGHNFDPGKLSTLTPGKTTLEEASRAHRAARQVLQTDRRHLPGALVLQDHLCPGRLLQPQGSAVAVRP